MLRPLRAPRASRPRPVGVGRFARRSWHVVLIALGLLLAQGPMLLHLLFVPHATCEHGELVEGARPRAEAPTPVKPGETQIERSHGSDAGHEHCDALAVRHRIPDVGPSVMAASLVEITLIDEGGERAGMRALPILSLAPKGSPPV